MTYWNLLVFVTFGFITAGCSLDAQLLRLASQTSPSITPPVISPTIPATSSFNVRANYPESRANAQQLLFANDGQFVFTSTIDNSYVQKMTTQGASATLTSGASQIETSFFRSVSSTLNSSRSHILQVGYYYDAATYSTSLALQKLDNQGVRVASFNNGEILKLALTPSSMTPRWIGVDSSERIYIAGETNSSPRDFLIARYLTDGTVDTSYGSGGLVQTDISSSSSDDLQDCTLQSDQKLICVGGANYSAKNYYSIVRYNVNGTLDISFAGDGILTDFFNTANFDRFHAVTLKPDDSKIYGLGRGTFGKYVIAFNSDGTKDNSFGTAGALNLGNDFGYTDHIALTPDENLIVVGSDTDADYMYLRVGKILSNGTFDPTFGTGGIVFRDDMKLENSAGEKVAADFFIDGSNNIYLYGNSFSADTSSSMFMLKLLPNGSPDNGFASSGLLRPSVLIPSNEEIKQSLKKDDDLYILGTMFRGRAAFISKQHNGVVDTSFGVQGHFSYYGGNFEFIEEAKLIEAPGGAYYVSLLVGNESTVTSENRILKITAAGVLDTSFNGTGIASLPNSAASSFGIPAVNSSGHLFIVSQLWDGPDVDKLVITKFTSAGVLDNTFGTGGELITAMEVWPLAAHFVNGRLLVSGNTGSDAYVLRFLSDGTLDTSFNTLGYTTYAIDSENQYMSIHLDSAQNISLFYAAYDGEKKFILKMDKDGVLDTSWGVGGSLEIAVPDTYLLTSIMKDSENRWVLVGSEEYVKGVAIRLTTAGNLDTTFANAGYLVEDAFLEFKSVDSLEDGGILIVGKASTSNGSSDAVVVRYDETGSH
ncbi:hypothetical protein ACLWBD_01740 [Bdellovibrio sp. HCB117]|uniref:hypothetical protein n=1 Tax=Bdellovibrio sp. HCB117 TaxID=3394359 RepID=UPI0039B4EA64